MNDEESFRTVLVGRVFLARAVGTVTQTELSRVLRAVAAARKAVDRPLLYWPVFSGPAEMPTGETRAAMQRATTSLFSYCEAMTLVITGDGLKQSLLRTGLRGLIAIGGYSNRVRIATSLAAAVEAANDSEIVLSELESAASAAGIWEAVMDDRSKHTGT